MSRLNRNLAWFLTGLIMTILAVMAARLEARAFS